MELKDVVDVLESKGSKDFATLLKSQNTMRSLADHNLTIFAPTDEALNSPNLDYQESVSKVGLELSGWWITYVSCLLNRKLVVVPTQLKKTLKKFGNLKIFYKSHMWVI